MRCSAVGRRDLVGDLGEHVRLLAHEFGTYAGKHGVAQGRAVGEEFVDEAACDRVQAASGLDDERDKVGEEVLVV